ncbi:hypothetical protein [Chromobacterium sp. CV08]|uniref:hypothetical protein n=1 Tax=Chromobacterium sp. CV08 TaxID=3133274 RepID=UPI003DA99B5C
MLKRSILAALPLLAAGAAQAGICERTAAPEYPAAVFRERPVKVTVEAYFETGADARYHGLFRLKFNTGMPEQDRAAFAASIETALRQYQCAPNLQLTQTFGFSYD